MAVTMAPSMPRERSCVERQVDDPAAAWSRRGARVFRARSLALFVLIVVVTLAPSQAGWAAPGGGGWASPLGVTLLDASPATAVLAAVPRAVGEPPETTIVGADDLWHNHDVVLTFMPRDDSGSVAAVQVRIDGGDAIDLLTAPYRLTVAASSDHSGDGSRLVEFRSLDADGSLEEWKSATVNIDTRRPTALVLHAVGVMRSTTTRVDFRVDDDAPNAGLAKAKVVISTWAGRDIQTLKLDPQSIGTDLVARFRCDLPRGFYRLRVEARDLAGNAATIVARTRLVVTDWMRIHSFGALVIDPRRLPYVGGTPTSRVDAGPHDYAGVRMYVSGGQLKNYPGGQARYGLTNLNTYRLTGDPFFLSRATAQARRLIDTHVSYGLAWFYPQRYSRYRHSPFNNGELMQNPWYSGMAQGQVLSFMVRMYEATGQEKYLTVARLTLNSLLYRGPASRPWVVNADSAKRLWIQEWPKLPLDYTFNGHMISSFGLYDYYRVTEDTLALVLFRAAASAALDYAPKFRRPGAISRYCLLHGTPNASYHLVHVTCLKHLYDFTGEPGFASLADAYLRDYSGPSGLALSLGYAPLPDLMSDSLEQAP